MTYLLEERPGPGRLGRHVEHDDRSRAYAYDTTGLNVTPVKHQRAVPVFDQGDLGSCTGNAGVGCLGTGPFYAPMTDDFPSVTLNEDLAVSVYSAATRLDDVDGTYPPDDTGSSGLGVAKALTALGYIAGYQHTFTFDDAMKALGVGPLMFGIPWMDSFDTPDPHGIVSWPKSAQLRGGHEIVADEIMKADSSWYVGFTNSWSTSWGVKGRFYAPFNVVEKMLANQGDVTILVPAADKPPTPGPTGPSGPTGPAPTPVTGPSGSAPADPADLQLLSDMQKWAKAKGLA